MYCVVAEGSESVAEKGGEEDERYYGVVDIIVYFELCEFSWCEDGDETNER